MANAQNAFIELMINKFPNLSKVAESTIEQEGDLFSYGFMHNLYLYCIRNNIDRCNIITHLEYNIDIFDDNDISNLITIGFIHSIVDVNSLNLIIKDCENTRKILCKYFIFQYLSSDYMNAIKLLRLYTGRDTSL